MKRIFQSLRILPRWIIIIIDVIILLVSCLLAYLLIFNFDLQKIYEFRFANGVMVYVITGIVAIFFTQSYSGIIRYTSLQDGLRVVYTTTFGAGLATLYNVINISVWGKSVVPFRIIIISYFASVIFLFSYRLIVKYLYNYFTKSFPKNKNILVFGAGESGQITKQIIDADKRTSARVVGFIDDNPKVIGKVINGINVYNGKSDLGLMLESLRIQEVIISVQNLTIERKNEIVNECLNHNVKIRSVPGIEKWVKGELSLNQIKEVKIEELLGRDSIELNNLKVRKDIANKCVLVTGAAGSIGAEIVRQVQSYNPKQLVLIDQAESPLYEIDGKVRNYLKYGNVVPVVADITNQERMDHIFDLYRPDTVFHAAAYKHVPMMENNPIEAVLCNVGGSKILADLSVKYHVHKFVMISTDKAVNPTNVMGASKRIAEIYVQSLNNYIHQNNPNATSFITTRFGNVLGSNGSVIPLFRDQIKNGGPLTVTHPEVTRFFMTIPEACQLVLEAGTMGKGGEIFIFDMGQSIKIIDLAKKMVQLSGLELGKDIEIVFTGLRQGEKLFEELLLKKENTIPTHHEKILIAKDSSDNYTVVKNQIEGLLEVSSSKKELEMVSMMKDIIPEFISNISKFEILDRKSSS